MGIAKYFETCKQFWLNNGCDEREANRRALWWDCKEVWDADKSWNKEKKNFFEAMKRNIPFVEG